MLALYLCKKLKKTKWDGRREQDKCTSEIMRNRGYFRKLQNERERERERGKNEGREWEKWEIDEWNVINMQSKMWHKWDAKIMSEGFLLKFANKCAVC